MSCGCNMPACWPRLATFPVLSMPPSTRTHSRMSLTSLPGGRSTSISSTSSCSLLSALVPCAKAMITSLAAKRSTWRHFPMPSTKSGRSPSCRRTSSRPFQVAADHAHRDKRQDLRLRGPEIHGAFPDVSPPAEWVVSGLHEAEGTRQGQVDAVACPVRQGLETHRSCLSARCRPFTGIAVQETPHAVDHDHPTGRLHQERRSQHV